VAPRPTSRERLPPMDGFPGSAPPPLPPPAARPETGLLEPAAGSDLEAMA
jgi:hypothetical protein